MRFALPGGPRASGSWPVRVTVSLVCTLREIIRTHSPIAREPAESSLNDPSVRSYGESARATCTLDDFAIPVTHRFGPTGQLLTTIRTVSPDDPPAAAQSISAPPRQESPGALRIVHVSWRHIVRQGDAWGINQEMGASRPFARLWASNPLMWADSFTVFTNSGIHDGSTRVKIPA